MKIEFGKWYYCKRYSKIEDRWDIPLKQVGDNILYFSISIDAYGKKIILLLINIV
jgi:hypothetical protein